MSLNPAQLSLLTYRLCPALYWSSLRLAGGVRRDVCVLTGLLLMLQGRIAKDYARGGKDVQAGSFTLAEMLEELCGPKSPPENYAGMALREVVRRHDIRKDWLMDWCDGVGMELVRGRYRDDSQLDTLIHKRVAIPAMMVLRVLGGTHDKDRRQFITFCRGWAMADYLAQWRFHLERGRIYFPQSSLAAAGVSESDLVAAKPEDALLGFLHEHAVAAVENLTSGGALLATIPERTSRQWLAAHSAQRVELLQQIARNPATTIMRPATLKPTVFQTLRLQWKFR